MIDKIQKIREEVKRLMYGFNLEADIASYEDAEIEKLANIKYQLCKKILEYIDKVQEDPVSVWHNVQYPYDETKPVLIVAIDHSLHLWKGKFDTDKMCNAFRLFTGTDRNNKPSSVVSKWAYIDDLLKF